MPERLAVDLITGHTRLRGWGCELPADSRWVDHVHPIELTERIEQLSGMTSRLAATLKLALATLEELDGHGSPEACAEQIRGALVDYELHDGPRT